MAFNWNQIGGAALETGKNEAIRLLTEYQDFIEEMPEVALAVAESFLPHRRKQPDYWAIILRGMSREQRTEYNRALVEDATKAAQITTAHLSIVQMFHEAFRALGEVGSAVVRASIFSLIEAIQSKANPKLPGTEEETG